MSFLKNYFSVSGDVSSLRANVLLAMLVFIALSVTVIVLAFRIQPAVITNAGIQTLMPADYTVIRELTYFAGTILFVAFGFKSVQKFAERTDGTAERETAIEEKPTTNN